MKTKILVILMLVLLTTSVNAEPLWKSINDGGKEIMWLEAHSDDEFMLPGTLAFAHAKNNTVRIIAVQCPTCCNPILVESRLIANAWLLENYLESYDYLGYNLSQQQNWNLIRQSIKGAILQYHPDIILCNSPYGYSQQNVHKEVNKAIRLIYPTLGYTPKVYWIINTNQDLPEPTQNDIEHILFPPNEKINLSLYSSVLGQTYWDSKVQIWQNYSTTLPQLQNLLANETRMQSNDKFEYFKKFK